MDHLHLIETVFTAIFTSYYHLIMGFTVLAILRFVILRFLTANKAWRDSSWKGGKISPPPNPSWRIYPTSKNKKMNTVQNSFIYSSSYWCLAVFVIILLPAVCIYILKQIPPTHRVVRLSYFAVNVNDAGSTVKEASFCQLRVFRKSLPEDGTCGPARSSVPTRWPAVQGWHGGPIGDRCGVVGEGLRAQRVLLTPAHLVIIYRRSWLMVM